MLTASPLMMGELIFIPKSVAFITIIVLVLLGIKEFRQGHIGRPGIFVNAILLWQIFYNYWERLPDWFQLYLNIGTIIAIIALVSYLSKFKLPKEFYQFVFIGYSSFSLVITVVIFFYLGLLPW